MSAVEVYSGISADLQILGSKPTIKRAYVPVSSSCDCAMLPQGGPFTAAVDVAEHTFCTCNTPAVMGSARWAAD